MRTLAQQVQEAFPGALPADEFLAVWQAGCEREGFTSDTSLLVVGVCRDEVCAPFVADLERAWGPAFNIGSLGGVVTVGRTGMAAVAGHAPQVADQPMRYVIVACAHVGMDPAGNFGRFRRDHQSGSSRACGALMTFRDELLTGHLNLAYDPADPEMSLMRQRIFSALNYGDLPDPVELTEVAAATIAADLDALIAESLAVPDREVQVAVVTGVLVHTTDGDWFQGHAPRIWSSRTGQRPVVLAPVGG
jgi:hypothetical protein